MKIKVEDLFEEEGLDLKLDLDLSDFIVDDVLVEAIELCKVKVKSYQIESDEIELILDVESKVSYLDARTLEKLTIDVDFSESIPFTSNQSKALKLDIDCITEELDLKQLVQELLIVYIPFNYSESEPLNLKTDEEFNDENSNKPFADLLKK